MLVYGKYECFVMHMLYVCILCASCVSSQCCVLHDLQFVNAGRGYKRRPYGRICLPQGVGAPSAMLRGRTAAFPKILGARDSGEAG